MVEAREKVVLVLNSLKTSFEISSDLHQKQEDLLVTDNEKNVKLSKFIIHRILKSRKIREDGNLTARKVMIKEKLPQSFGQQYVRINKVTVLPVYAALASNG
jgi:hypothetical protein